MLKAMFPFPRQYFLVGLLVFLAACSNGAIALPAKTPIQTVVSPTPVPTSTIILVTDIPTSLPPQPTMPIITPDAVQVERWKEYQTELAKLVLSDSGAEFPLYKEALCEWDILGRSDQEVYVWARCRTANSGDRRPAVIYLATDESIQKVEVPFHVSAWESTIQKLFPADVRDKIELYFYLSSINSGRPEELRKHLIFRLTHPEVPPLTILSTMPVPTP